MLIKPTPPHRCHPAIAVHVAPALRCSAVAALQVVSAALERLAQWLAVPPAQPSALPAHASLEFHAEAGAPEGALYVDGQLAARLVGINRL